jgi:glycosyltransferase involved in cell wall biosynthesis
MVGPFALDPMGTVRVRMVPIAEALRSSGHDARIVLPPYDNPSQSGISTQLRNVPIYNIRLSRIPLLKHIMISLRLTITAFSLRPSIVHVFKPKGYSGVTAMIHILLRKLHMTTVPVVVDTDDHEGASGFGSFYRTHRTRSSLMVFAFDFQERWISRNADQLTVASRGLLDISSRRFRIDPKKMHYVPNGATRDLLNNESNNVPIARVGDSNTILLYTRFLEFSVDRLLEIFQRVKSSIPSAKLVVVGKGSFGEEENLVSLAKKRGVGDAITYLGWALPKDLGKVLEVGDVAIYPIDDNLMNRTKCPGKLIELLSIGKPVVAEDVGQIREYVRNGETGLIVPSGENERFAEQIIRLLQDKELRERLGRGARDDVLERFDWSDLTRVVEDCYSKTIEHYNGILKGAR